jgi:hypothetical protein
VKRSLLAGAAAIALGTPALADHTGPSGVGSGGGSINVISPDTLDECGTAVGFRLTYTRPEQRSDVELEALAAEHIHAHNSRYTLNAALGAAYGITHELTVSAELPYVRRDRIREGEHAHVGGEAINEVAQLGSVAGIGDLSLLAKYRLTRGSGPAFALIGGLKVPTGSTHRRTGAGERFETEHQPGSGSWDPIIGAAFGTAAGTLRLNASALYQIAGKGAQHTRLGDRLQGGIALSHRFGAEHHDEEAGHHHDEAGHHRDAGEAEHDHADAEPHGHQSWDAFVDLSGEWEGRQTVAGEREQESGGTALWISPGARFNSAGGLSAAVAIGLPVWQRVRASHPDNDYRLTLSLGRAF